jgi:hypothetical protein
LINDQKTTGQDGSHDGQCRKALLTINYIYGSITAWAKYDRTHEATHAT